MNTQCEDCLKFFNKENLQELVLTQEKTCKECYEKRKVFNQLDDPYPFP